MWKNILTRIQKRETSVAVQLQMKRERPSTDNCDVFEEDLGSPECKVTSHQN